MSTRPGTDSRLGWWLGLGGGGCGPLFAGAGIAWAGGRPEALALTGLAALLGIMTVALRPWRWTTVPIRRLLLGPVLVLAMALAIMHRSRGGPWGGLVAQLITMASMMVFVVPKGRCWQEQSAATSCHQPHAGASPPAG